ncbi:MAG TPA: DUF5946 family protein [Thermoanaerobaculia bacterium]|nr:DUF5946 family protein [Thermoanaerobaculia bacterium]
MVADSTKQWPHFDPPESVTSMTVFDVAIAGTAEEHIAAVRDWSRRVWSAWSTYHAAVAELIASNVKIAPQALP